MASTKRRASNNEWLRRCGSRKEVGSRRRLGEVQSSGGEDWELRTGSYWLLAEKTRESRFFKRGYSL
jgi:hypothetical protein